MGSFSASLIIRSSDAQGRLMPLWCGLVDSLVESLVILRVSGSLGRGVTWTTPRAYSRRDQDPRNYFLLLH